MILRFVAPIIPLLLLPALLLAQEEKEDPNLVPNGSFEETEGKLKRLGNIEQAMGWKSPTLSKADLYTETVAGAPITAPRNEYGDQSPLTGQNYAGVRWWSYQNKEPRSYLQAKLKKPLKKGQKYCVKFYTSLADLSKYSSNEIGVYLSRMVVSKNDESNLTYDAQIPHLRSQIYEDMYSWQGVCGVYTSAGDETYILIGNFKVNERTDTGKPKRPKGDNRPQMMEAYYYIDDVSVLPIKLDSECTCEQLDKAESEFIFSRKGAMPSSAKPAQKVDAQVFYFKRFQRTIDRAMEPWIAMMIEDMIADPSIRVKLVGHVDETEGERTRMRPDLETLGLERAEAVKESLLEGGIAGSRITVESKKDAQPADATGSEVGMSKNRRVEVELMK